MTTARLSRRQVLGLLAAPAMAAVRPALAADPVKVGLVLTMSGPFASSGEIMANAAKLYLATEGRAVLGGQPVELIIRDDGGTNPDTAKRLVQELMTRDRVQYLVPVENRINA